MKQTNETAKSDVEIIKQKILGYIEAWYAGGPWKRGEKPAP